MKLVVEFGGGLETLVEGSRKRVELELKGQDQAKCQEVIDLVTSTLIVDKKNLFILNSKIRSLHNRIKKSNRCMIW